MIKKLIQLVLITTNVIMILLVGYLGIRMYDQIVILATSLCGSFAAIFSIGMLANNFPDIYALAKKIKVGEIDSVRI